MMISVLIPSFGRPAKLLACLERLVRQEEAPEHEILVALDGGDEREAREISERFPELSRRLDVRAAARSGYIPVRRDLLRRARGDVFLSLNDDVLPAPDLLAVHARLHADAAGPVVVAGAAPWTRAEDRSLLETVIERGDLVFFDPDQREPAAPDAAHRRVFGLNFSASVRLALEAGGFHDLPFEYGYDDVELAWRLREAGAAIVRAPHAVAEHDHRLDGPAIVRREYALGRAAHAYRRVSPAFSLELHGEDLAAPEVIERYRTMNESLARDARRSAEAVLALGTTPDFGPDRATIAALAAAWIPAKRWLWRRGVIDAAAGRPADAEAAAAELLGSEREPVIRAAGGGRPIPTA